MENTGNHLVNGSDAVLSEMSKPKCPNCGKDISYYTESELENFKGFCCYCYNKGLGEDE